MLTKCVEMGRVSYSDHFSFSPCQTVAPLNNGHIGTSHFFLYREVVLSSEVKSILV